MATAKNRRGDAAENLTLERFLPYRLSVLANTVSLKVAAAYQRRFGLTIPEWRVMAMLAQYPNISAVDVAERTAMDKVAVSRAVQALMAKGHIKRETHAEDRRRSMLTLSAAGRGVYKRVIPIARAFEQQLLDELSGRERKVLEDLITRLHERAQTLR
ncbi:MAG TPA: MarR family transcriptional regulator [Steroidobacteraceae bacterium]|nr:MarR family transcriptional regulator [Steroidobacteraceae bacterium]